jgi:hypothetical protein
MIQQEAMDIYATSTGKKKSVKAGGPGSGRHPEYGSFKKGFHEDSGSGTSSVTRYSTPQNSHVTVHQQGYGSTGRITLTHPDRTVERMKYRDGVKKLSETYGIQHE